MIYLLQPELVKKPWGIRNVGGHTGIKPSRADTYGEVWLASAHMTDRHKHQDGAKSNIVLNYKNGKENLHQLINDLGRKFLGKIRIDKKPKGKAESWYFREVAGKVKIVTGIKKSITKTKFAALVSNGYFEKHYSFERMEKDLLKTTLVKTGDAFILYPGTVHTIYPMDKGSYAIIDEVQQGFGHNNLPTLTKILMVSSLLSLQVHPSDKAVRKEKNQDIKQQFLAEPTLRISDFGRKRKSHTEVAIKYIKFSKTTCIKVKPRIHRLAGMSLHQLIHTKYFSKDKIILKRGSINTLSHKNHYYVYQILKGTIKIDNHTLKKGAVFAVPATTSSITIEAVDSSTLLRDYVQ